MARPDGDHRRRRLAGLPIALARNRVPAGSACPVGGARRPGSGRAGAQRTRLRHRRAGRAGMRRHGHAHPPPNEAGRIGGHAGPRPFGLHPGRRLRPRPGAGKPSRPGIARRPWLAFHAAGRSPSAAGAGRSRTPPSCGSPRARRARPRAWCSLTARCSNASPPPTAAWG